MNNGDEYQRWFIVQERTGLSRNTAWRLEQINQFPKRRKISCRNVAWLKSEIDEWLKTRQLASELL